MSYISKKGAGAIESATTEKQDYSKAIKSLKSGSSYKVRVLNAEEVVEVYMHSVFGVFYSTPCTREDAYDKAVDLLYKDAKAIEDTDEKQAEQIRKHAYALKAKPRYLFGFINLEDGEPMIVDLSKKQAQGIISTIKKYEKRLDQLAFELSKQGSGQSTTVTLNPLMFLEEDLEKKELENFNKTADVKEIDGEVYENCLYVKNEQEVAEDIVEYEKYARKGSKALPSIELNLVDRLGIDTTRPPADAPEEDPEPIEGDGEEGYDF